MAEKRSSQPCDTPSIEERQLRVLLHDADPARAAMLDVEPTDAGMDDAAVRSCIDHLEAVGAARDGSTAGRLLSGMADLLERRWFG